jgi:hypothetical protein
MISFTKRADTLPELAAQVPLLSGHRMVKNREARFHCPAAVIVPTEVEHVQQCVQWTVKQRVSLTVIGGGHSGHCFWFPEGSARLARTQWRQYVNFLWVGHFAQYVLVGKKGC